MQHNNDDRYSEHERTHVHDHDHDLSRKRQTFFLSAEFLITMIVQTAVFLVLGTTAINRIDGRVSALEAQQVTAERVARIEERITYMQSGLAAVLTNQEELKTTLNNVKEELQSQPHRQ